MVDLDQDLSPHFPILRQLLFLNHAGVAPITGPAALALRRYADEAQSQAYFGSHWYRQVRELKRLAAQLINGDSDHIAIIPNTSTGLSMLAGGLDWVDGDNVVLASIEYPANRYPWENLRSRGVELIEVRPDADGRVPSEEIAEAVTDRTRVVAISHVQYGSGQRMELRQISDMVHWSGGYLCVDAIQSLGVMPVDVQAMGIDFLASGSHKWLLSTEGCGFLYCTADLLEMLWPPVVGWMCMVDADNYDKYRFELASDARRFEPGTYNVPGIMALTASLDMLLEIGIDRIWSRIEALTNQLCEGLSAKGYHVFSSRRPDETSGIVSFDPPMIEPQEIVVALEKQGIVIVERLGHLRASPHFYNTPEQMEQLVEALP